MRYCYLVFIDQDRGERAWGLVEVFSSMKLAQAFVKDRQNKAIKESKNQRCADDGYYDSDWDIQKKLLYNSKLGWGRLNIK